MCLAIRARTSSKWLFVSVNIGETSARDAGMSIWGGTGDVDIELAGFRRGIGNFRPAILGGDVKISVGVQEIAADAPERPNLKAARTQHAVQDHVIAESRPGAWWLQPDVIHRVAVVGRGRWKPPSLARPLHRGALGERRPAPHVRWMRTVRRDRDAFTKSLHHRNRCRERLPWGFISVANEHPTVTIAHDNWPRHFQPRVRT